MNYQNIQRAFDEAYRQIGDAGITINPNMTRDEFEKAGKLANRLGLGLVLDNGNPCLEWSV